VEEDVSSYWMTLKKSEGTSKRKRQIALFGALAFEEAMELMNNPA
jgi:hypothetical protein